MIVVHGAELIEIVVDGGESAKNLNRPGMLRLLAMADARKIDAVIIAKLDRLTRSVKDLAELLERFERRSVSLISVAESLDTVRSISQDLAGLFCGFRRSQPQSLGRERRQESL